MTYGPSMGVVPSVSWTLDYCLDCYQLPLTRTPLENGTVCTSKRDVLLTESQLTGVRKGRDQL